MSYSWKGPCNSGQIHLSYKKGHFYFAVVVFLGKSLFLMKNSQNIIESIENSLIDMFCVATKKKTLSCIGILFTGQIGKKGYLLMDKVSLLII